MKIWDRQGNFFRRGGILSKISNVFKRKKKNATTTVEKFLSAKNPDSNPKGQWYEQGKQKRITKQWAMKKQKNTYFWTSYSDLMTSLFFIMLVLFALTTIMLKKKNDATERELENIRKVEASTEDLRGEYFEYRKDYEKFILKVNCNFPIAQYTLRLLEIN